jgi:hypothetical protein
LVVIKIPYLNVNYALNASHINTLEGAMGKAREMKEEMLENNVDPNINWEGRREKCQPSLYHIMGPPH